MAAQNDEFSTTIGKDAVFKGQLRFEKGLQLLGKVEGEIHSKGQLVICEGATFCGDASAGNILLAGEVKGNLSAENKVQLAASAKLEGDVETARLEVAEGAVLVGRCTIGVNGKEGRAARPTSSPSASGAKPRTDETRRRP